MLICCSCTRYSESIKEIYIVPKNPIGFSHGSFRKDSFLAALKTLHIGEWRRRYSTERFGYEVCDGTQWELEFEYNNGHKPVRFNGDNSYPYNFGKFKKLFGID